MPVVLSAWLALTHTHLSLCFSQPINPPITMCPLSPSADTLVCSPWRYVKFLLGLTYVRTNYTVAVLVLILVSFFFLTCFRLLFITAYTQLSRCKYVCSIYYKTGYLMGCYFPRQLNNNLTRCAITPHSFMFL
jgi:hypothetical protein